MGKQLGSNATVEVSTDGGVTFTKAFRVKKASFTPKNNLIDATDNDSNGWKEQLYGDSHADLSFTCNYDPTDSGQAAVINAKITKTTILLRYRPRGTGASLPQIFGLAQMEETMYDSEHEKTQELVCTGKSTAAWTENLQ